MVRCRYCQVKILIPCSSFQRRQGSGICAAKITKKLVKLFNRPNVSFASVYLFFIQRLGSNEHSCNALFPQTGGEWSRKWSNREEGGGFCPHLKFGSKSDPPNGDNLFWFPSTRIISAAAHLDEVGDQKIITSGCRWRWLSCCDEMSVRGWGYR